MIPWAIATPAQAELSGVTPASVSPASVPTPSSRGLVSPISMADAQFVAARNMAAPTLPYDGEGMRTMVSPMTLHDEGRMTPLSIQNTPTLLDVRPATDGLTTRFIPSELVVSHIHASDDFLDKSRRPKGNLLHDAPGLIVAIDENAPSDTFASTLQTMNSPTLGVPKISASAAAPGAGSQSPITAASTYDALVTRERSSGQASQGTMSSRASSLVVSRSKAELDDPTTFPYHGHTPASPPLSHKTSSSTDHNGNALATHHLMPPIDQGFECGLEVVGPAEMVDLPMLASEIEHLRPVTAPAPSTTTTTATTATATAPAPTAAISIISHERPMRVDGSFFKYGGFCDGAKAISRGEAGFKVNRKTVRTLKRISESARRKPYTDSIDARGNISHGQVCEMRLRG